MASTDTNSSDWRPQESSQDILAEHAWLQGAVLASVAFGMSSILYFMTIHLLRMRPASSESHDARSQKKRIALIIYITLIFMLGILYMAGLLQFTQLSFIDDRDYPGGPNAFEQVMFSLPVDMLGNVTMVILTWMCDIINVRAERHRCLDILMARFAGLEMHSHLQWVAYTDIRGHRSPRFTVFRIHW